MDVDWALVSHLRSVARAVFGPSIDEVLATIPTTNPQDPSTGNDTTSKSSESISSLAFPKLPLPLHIQHYTVSGQPIPPYISSDMTAMFRIKTKAQINRLSAFDQTKGSFETTPQWSGVDWSLLQKVAPSVTTTPPPTSTTPQQPSDTRAAITTKPTKYVPVKMSCYWGTQKELLAKGLSLKRGARGIVHIPLDGSWIRCAATTTTTPSSDTTPSVDDDGASAAEDARYEQLLNSLALPDVQTRGKFASNPKTARLKNWFGGLNNKNEAVSSDPLSVEEKKEPLYNLSQCVDSDRAIAAVRGARYWAPLPHLPSVRPHDAIGGDAGEEVASSHHVSDILTSIKEGGNEASIFADPFYYFKFKNGHGEHLPRVSNSCGDSDARRANAVAHRLHALLALLLHPNTFPELVCTAEEAARWWKNYIVTVEECGTNSTTTLRPLVSLPSTASTTNSPPAWLTAQVCAQDNAAADTTNKSKEASSPYSHIGFTSIGRDDVERHYFQNNSINNMSPLASVLLSQYADLTYVPLAHPSSTATPAHHGHHHHGTFPLHNYWLTEEEMEALGLQLTDDPATIGGLAVIVALHTYLKKYFFGDSQSSSTKSKRAKSTTTTITDSTATPPTTSLWNYDGIDSLVASTVMNSTLLALETANRLGTPLGKEERLTSPPTTTTSGPKATMVSISGARKKNPVGATTSDVSSSSPIDIEKDRDVSMWVLNEVAKADALQVVSILSATNTPTTATTTPPKQQKFPFLPDSLEVVLMDVFSTTVKRLSNPNTTPTPTDVSIKSEGAGTPSSSVQQRSFKPTTTSNNNKFPEGFVDMLSFNRCSDGKRVYSALLCATRSNDHNHPSGSESTMVLDILNHSCITPTNYPASPDANTIVISGDGDGGGVALQGRPQPPASRCLLDGGVPVVVGKDEWIPVQLLGSERLLGNELPPTVLGQLTTYRAQHGAWNSQVWQVAHFSTVGTSSPAAGHPPLVYSGWVHRRDYDLACNDAGVIHGNSSHISTIVVQLPPNSNVSRLGGEEVVPVPNHESGNASTTSTNQAPPNLPACNITLTLPITVASPPTCLLYTSPSPRDS
eukprot:TRINITY_DN4741_c0_g1_i24.p1 TRINITY_DN4741_c0_g1~~TRINITY_DN4741_c0_g1_i24.p1  ORF type:complete len:1077 (+),score=145.83 TRINITY_DN4741_c0_g1_i24:269-3499(+)